MDQIGPELLTKILTIEELGKTPKDVQEKINKYFEEIFDEFLTTKAVGETSRNTVDEIRTNCEKKVEDLTSQLQDYELKLKNSERNVVELRKQMDTYSAERTNLMELTNKYETELSTTRREKNSIKDERDALFKSIERQNSELERMQQELRSCQKQLKAAINSKCEALARVDEIESKEAALNFKEKRMEQERSILTNQVQTLSHDLNRNISELQNIRRENTIRNMQLETRLNEKMEELKIAHTQCAHYKETIDSLTANSQELSAKMLAQSEEANKMMEFYKKELQAKTKLSELYKANSEERAMESNEMGQAITDLKRMLAEASDQYGELETNLKSITMKHEEEMEEKNKTIDALKAEILHANDLLKEVQSENMENAIEKLAPSAAVASRLIKSDMTLTELYSLYVKATEDSELQKRENNRLNLQMKTILHELEERAPQIKKQEIEYEKLIEANNILAAKLDELIVRRTDNQQEMEEAQTKISHLERENKKLKHSQSDLSRQVCYLLKEIEQNRCGYTSENQQQLSHNLSTDEVISKKLVTFSNITELHENNQKLLLLVRDLSDKLEEIENLKQQISEASYKEKIENYTKKMQSMQESLQNQTKMLNTCMAKCERYKRLYFEAFTKNANNSSKIRSEDTDESMEMDGSNTAAQNTTNDKEASEKDKKILELENQLAEVKKQAQSFKEQYEYYTQEKKNNEKILNDQFDSMRTEVRELTATNCKLMSTVEYNKELLKIQQKNISTYKQQIAALEDRNKNYENTNIKHEQTTLYLKDEIMKAQKSLSAAESELNHLRQETRLLKDAASRLQSEKEGYHRERQNQHLLLNNLEMIKASFERSEMEGKARLESRLDETQRELSAQRRRYQEEQDRFRELAADMKRQTETAKERMEEESRVAEQLRQEMLSLRNELKTKSLQIDELSKKLQESLAPTKDDNPIAVANKKIRELEMRNEECKLEIQFLSSELAKSKEHAEQYFKISESAEKEIKNLDQLHNEYVVKAEAEIKALKQTEADLRSRIEELETEIQLQTVTEAQNSGSARPVQLQKTQDELKETLQKLNECNRELRNVRSEYNSLSESLNSVEQKYANEMVLHSADIQELSKVKSELLKIREQISSLQEGRDTAVNELNENRKTLEETRRLLQTEKEGLESRLADLDSQNASLHNQIQALTSKLSVISSSNVHTTTNDSLNESSDINKSIAEEDIKNNDQLLQIIKYLRKEKDIAVAKFDILKSENVRLVSEYTISQKKIDELNGFLNQERSKSETSSATATRHEEILRKIETLNAITDSNRILREERDTLSARVKELSDRTGKIEDELFPLQKQNHELSSKIEELSTENNSLRTEAIKWRQRANVLIEKNNKNPEEFKRLQIERENLAKMLTSEKEILKQVNEELNQIKTEKVKMEVEIANLGRQLTTVNEEKKKLTDDFNLLKQQNSRLTQEVMELKNQLLQKEETMQKITEDLESKDAQLVDSKNKEIQIRKIAKRYKDSFIELSNKQAASTEVNAGGDNLNAGANPGESGTSNKADNEKELKETIEQLNSVIKTIQEENEKMRKDNEELRSSVEKDERGKLLLREAKSRIMSLTESKNLVSQELAQTKTKLQNLKQSTEDHDTILAGIKTQYDEKLSRLEKDLLEQTAGNKEAIARLTRENESLLVRISQLNRQLGLQQSAKPSTSSSAISDKGCISESSPRTANVKPMSGSSSQQSATVTPWRGGDTPLASIRPISVQNSRTAAILPTSQNSTISVGQGSASGSNTALVPPQQQVHTTGSNVESMSSSPTSSHTDYMPSTSTAAVAVAAVPPMGASAAECSQEAESVPLQTNDSQVMVSGGQQQVVALVSPRVEGSQNAPVAIQSQQEPNNQPSTSGTTSSSHVSISSHRHASSSSNVTTTQASGHKRPRDIEGDSSTSTAEDCGEKSKPLNKRTRTGEAMGSQVGVSESGVDVEYQVPTSSQRDQEDDIVIVDSEEDEGMVDEGNAEADDGPAEDGENEGYEDSYEQDQDMDENECPEVDESNIQADNNEVEIDDCMDAPVQCTSENQADPDAGSSVNQDNNQQSQAISSGSCEPANVAQAVSRKQTTTLSRQQKATLMMLQQGIEGGESAEEPNTPQFSGHRSDSESVSSPQGSKFVEEEGGEAKNDLAEDAEGDEFLGENYEEKKEDETAEESEEAKHSGSCSVVAADERELETAQDASVSHDVDSAESRGGATQSGSEIQQNQIEGTAAEDSEGVDAVSSEGEKANLEEDLEEEGREAEASTSPSINTRSKTTRGNVATRRPRGYQRGGRPTPIVWQDQSGSPRNASPNVRNQDPGSPSRGFQNQRAQRARRMRRPSGINYGNMRYS
ncbi:nucleoprotein TPR isoform X2 [Eupeodes corollae]|uniref:nucleoprotein TPR isoform X2 n=1 Tax=Eupeodes corollae TaxID=290404 RepID=UPI002493400F|nr:nucleoprotein TPR isoform X2 [Eupeodes corollae]